MTEEAWMTFMPDGTDDDVWYTNPEGKLPEGYTYQKLNPNWSKEMAQPEQEPVAWWNDTGTHIDLNVSGRGTPLYTHPVKDLEDIDINITWNENSMRDFGKDELNFARAILRKAQEK